MLAGAGRWVSGCEKMPAWWYLLVVWGRGGTRPLNFVAPGRNRISWVALRLRFYCGIWSVQQVVFVSVCCVLAHGYRLPHPPYPLGLRSRIEFIFFFLTMAP